MHALINTLMKESPSLSPEISVQLPSLWYSSPQNPAPLASLDFELCLPNWGRFLGLLWVPLPCTTAGNSLWEGSLRLPLLWLIRLS